jgi:hypothetical protein
MPFVAMENATTTPERVPTHHEGTEPVTDTVLRTVAEREGCSQLELPLLYESVDPDALNALFADSGAPFASSSIVVEFEYAGYAVRIDEPGVVELRSERPSLQPIPESGRAD